MTTARNQLPSLLVSPRPLPPLRESLLLPFLSLLPFFPPPLPPLPPHRLPPPSTSSPQLVVIWIWPTKKLVSESKISWTAGLQHEIWKSLISKERSFKMATDHQITRMCSSKERNDKSSTEGRLLSFWKMFHCLDLIPHISRASTCISMYCNVLTICEKLTWFSLFIFARLNLWCF